VPGSASVFDNVMKEMIRTAEPSKVIDIGPGGGKYGKMLKDIEGERGRGIWKTCVEIDGEKVIARHGLNSIYDEIIIEDAARLARNYPALTADVVVAADVIEHLTKSDGVDLIEYLQYRIWHTFLIIPVDFVSFDFEDYDHESHISIWRREDFRRFEGAYCIERELDGCSYLLAVVNSIRLKSRDHFIVQDNFAHTGLGLPTENGIEFGFLNRR
jgi:hypothetical protein